MVEVLWPSLLRFVTPVSLTHALTPLCKSLLSLAAQKQDQAGADLQLPWEPSATLPTPQALLARLLVVASRPYVGEGRGVAVLRLLHILSLGIHKATEPLWSQEIPALLEHLEANPEASLPLKEWQDQLLQFLQRTLATIADTPWICQLVVEMCGQLNSYNGLALEKNFLYRGIGVSLAACTCKDLVRLQLRDLLETARYQEEAEREGLATCVGLCAVSHLDEALGNLEEFVRSDVFRRSAGLFGLFKDRSDHEAEKVKSALILCYGYVAKYAPRELLLARIDADILPNIFLYFHTKDLALKLCLIRSICLISQAICCSAQPGDYSFSRKVEVVTQMLDFIKTEPLDGLRTPLRQKAMTACMHLVVLEPPLNETERVELVDTCLHNIFPLPLPEASQEGQGPELEGRVKEPLWPATLAALRDLFKSLLCRHMTPHGLQTMFEHLAPWIRSAKDYERERAVEVSAALLQFYREKLNVSKVISFYNLGQLMALFAPRCTDCQARVRQQAVDCIHSLLYIQLGYEGFSRDHRDESVEQLKALKPGLKDPDVNVLFQTCCSIAKVIAKHLPPDQLLSLLRAMLEGLADPDRNCSRAAVVMVNAVLKERGMVLLEQVSELLESIHAQLQEVQEESVRKAAQQTVYILATQHKAAVVSSLLSYPLPHDSCTGTMWRALASQPPLTSQVLELLLEKVNGDVPYKENKSFLRGSCSEKVATFCPLAATCALHEIMSVRESGPAVAGLYTELFVSLLLRVSCTVGVRLPRTMQTKERRSVSHGQPLRPLDPCSSAVETLKAMLAQGGTEAASRAVAEAGGWELLRSLEKHYDGVALLARAMANHAGPRLSQVVKTLSPMLNSIYDSQRLTTTAFFAELLGSNVANDLVLLESMMDSMMTRQRDSSVVVRMLALRGLGNMASGSPEKARQHGAQLLASMITGLDDKDDPHNLVALEAMSSLSKVLPFPEEKDVQSVLLHLTIRIRPFFDSEEPTLRKTSIVLFGNLSKFSPGSSEEAFFEQVLSGLVTLLLHLQDPKPEVIKACKFTLRMCGPRTRCPDLNDMFQNHLHEARSLHYGEFMNDVCKHLMRSCPETLHRLVGLSLFYFKSSWADLRAAAPMFVGFLVLHADREQSQQLDLSELIGALAALLKDPVTTVRMKAVETLGRLGKVA